MSVENNNEKKREYLVVMKLRASLFRVLSTHLVQQF